ncbi:MAG: type I DNA topoisomerase [Parachlamydiaceae bacterium]
MGKSLIIVESPAKIKTLKKFLGPEYAIESSIGHIRDLPAKEFGIDIEHDFEPTYVTMPGKEEVIKKLKKAAKEADIVYLSPDPDREGEAIAWHISQILPPQTKYKRVSFNAITKEAVLKALKEPREIDEALVSAQQARRSLDRIVGYKISPILNRRIQRGKEGFVSAGRVQSVALKLVVDREKEIEAFVPVEYWNLGAHFKAPNDEKIFKANLHSVDGLKVEKERQEGKDAYLISDERKASDVSKKIAIEPYKVSRVEKKEKRRNPSPPFITSTLQQEASRYYGFSSQRTMSIAQSLYEGVDLGNEGTEGLITYMRTDSVRIEPQAIDEARRLIARVYGSEYLPSSGKQYAAQKSAQDAHEGIRPTNIEHTPEKVARYLTDDQFKLYQLIFRRFIASQMNPAIYDTVSADLENNQKILLRATGSILKFAGFLAIYEEREDDKNEDDEGKILPELEEGMTVKLIDLIKEQAFTRPPPRFTEASLVKELEKQGIGRPSTYATIMSKIQSRDYTIKEQGRLKPTELGFVIAALLEANFSLIMNIGFTAEMENELEAIADQHKDWKALLKKFWSEFEPVVTTAEKEGFVPKIQTSKICPKCGSNLQKVWFKNKYFYGCSKYPDCDFSSPIEEFDFDRTLYAEDFDWDQKCSKCGSPMKLRFGKFGAFLGCTGYPDCKSIVNIPKKGETVIPEQEMPKCPAIGCPGQMSARKSRFGKTFYSCSTYPECDVIVNDLSQLEEKYPDHPRTAYVKKAKKGRFGKKESVDKGEAKPKKAAAKKAPSKKKPAKKETGDEPKAKRVQPAKKLSEPLADLLGESELSRPDATKKIWEYVRANNLQNPQNKKEIIPDAKLSRALNVKAPFDMFQLAKLLNDQLS